MATVTRAQIRARVRRYADFPNADQGKLDTDLNEMISDAIADYYDLLVSVRGHSYFEATDEITILANAAQYTLPTNFYQLSTVVLVWGANEHEEVHAAPSNRNLIDFANGCISWDRESPKCFRLTGDQDGNKYINFYPTPTSGVQANLRYIPVFDPLSADSGAGGTIEVENSWCKMIAYDVAAEFRGLLGLPNSYQREQCERQRERVLEMATERLQDDAAEIVDASPGSATWYPRPRWNSA